MDLLYAPEQSSLHSLALTLSRIENLSHIVAWTTLESVQLAARKRATDSSSALQQRKGSSPAVTAQNTPTTTTTTTTATPTTQSTPPPLAAVVPIGLAELKIVELPRLKLRFQSRRGRLYSVDHTDLFISNDRHELVQRLVAGIPHALIMSSEQDEKQLLVPVLCPRRPAVDSQPFSTELVMDRRSKKAEPWYTALTQRFYLYPVHLSLSFLMTKGVNSALYLLLLRFLNRDYAAVNGLVDSVATDMRCVRC